MNLDLYLETKVCLYRQYIATHTLYQRWQRQQACLPCLARIMDVLTDITAQIQALDAQQAREGAPAAGT
jgi:hypothetical protein